MTSDTLNPDQYIQELPEERKEAMITLRQVINQNIPAGFEERMGYGMPGYVVPHFIYPSGYHFEPKTLLPFLGLASQKNFIAVYHMGIYTEAINGLVAGRIS